MERTRSPIHDCVPVEIIELILSKCPVKSVIRFKSVSKSWLSIISDPRFSRMLESKLLSESKKKFFLWAELYHKFPSPFYVTLEDGKFRKESVLGYPAIAQRFDLSPLCFCDGLILLGKTNHQHLFQKRYMLWNPLIRKQIIIPVPDLDTDASPHHEHLYRDSITDGYKIVFFYEKWYTVYSCKSGSWGEIKDYPRDWDRHWTINAVVDGCVYSLHSGEIICFDARDGKLHKLPQPEGVETLVKVVLEEVSGRLCLYGCDQDYDDAEGEEDYDDAEGEEDYDDEGKLQLWVMEKEKIGKCWRNIIISLEKVTKWEKSSLVLRCLTDEDDVILWSPCVFSSKRYLMYSPGSPSLREIELRFTWRDLKLPDNVCGGGSRYWCDPDLEIHAHYYTTHLFSYSETLYMPSIDLFIDEKQGIGSHF